jgi:hypothetical protein
MDDSATAPDVLVLVIESSTSPVVGESAVVRAEAQAAYRVLDYGWTVNDPEGEAVTLQRLAADRVSFVLQRAGGYAIACVATLEDGTQRSDAAVLQVREASAGSLVYTAQIVPPPASGAAAAEVAVTVGDQDQQGLVWTVTEGLEISLEVVAASASLPTFVRLIAPGGLSRDLYLAQGRANVRASGSFDALFIPGGDAIAPALRAGVRAAEVAPTWRVPRDSGETLSGSVEVAGGPLSGATVTARSQQGAVEVPSTLAVTGADGTFSLRARPGPVSLLVVPPEDRPLPLAVVEADGLTLAGSAADWRFSFEASDAQALQGTVTRADGQTPLSGARVVLRSAQPLTGVGRLEVEGQSYPAVGRFHRELTSDGAGRLVDLAGETPRVPPGSYRLEVEPGDGAPEGAGEGRRIFEVEVEDETQVALSLARRAVIRGAVRDGGGSAIVARVSAAGRDSTGEFATTTDDQGQFALHVDSGLTYALAIRPLLSRSGAEAGPLLLGERTITEDTDLQQLVLPRAVTLAGTVKTGGGLAMAQALIRIWCSGVGCPSPDVVDETLTGHDGRFVLRVPPP